MDAIALLKADHRDVEDLFGRFEALGPRALKSKRRIADKVIEALSIHASIEETVLYPTVRRRLADQEPTVLEALEEHHVVKWMLSELEHLDPDDERFDAKFTVMAENVRHHVKEEETELFKVLRKEMSRTELVELGAALAEAKRTAPSRPHPRAPDSPPGNLAAAAITAPLDAARQIGERTVQIARDAVADVRS